MFNFVLLLIYVLAPRIIRLPSMTIGQTMPNIQIRKDQPDPLLLRDDEYPSYIWDSLHEAPKISHIEDHEIQTRQQLRAVNQMNMKLNNFKARLRPF